MSGIIYKIVPADLWQQAEASGTFTGAPIDIQDGYIHFSTSAQARRTAELYFHGQTDLLLVAVDDAELGDKLVYEPSRGGDLFPHLYGTLPVSAILWAKPLPLEADGNHRFPEDMQ
ncbi:DUF952 domain-containing protein [Rhizobium sp. KVB221]|uniref:DUF952 domain-containing protein n=1 Tax=Rhizobium setariae TaxID=2801340 RepID=A0A936YK53_9HYPH|nr:DUF952 domain-containing protein [Rhizobium setariae]MBL0371849.1 DUF952 domain-containing protein [Rhizobium setariae]